MRCLVTGLTGFVGGHFAEAMLAHSSGVQLHGLNRAAALPPALAQLGGSTTLHAVDMHDPDAVLRTVQAVQPEAVVHLAGYANTAKSFRESAACWHDNLDGTRVLLDAIVASGLQPRVLFASTGMIYGEPDAGTTAMSEFTRLKPISPYAASKAAADLLCYQYHRTHQMNVVTLRLFNQLGPRQGLGFFATDKAQQIVEIERGDLPPTLRTGDLSAYRDLTDVRDMARAMVLLLRRGVAGEAYNAGSGQVQQIRSIVTRMLQLAQVPIELREIADPNRVPETAVSRADSTKLRTTTGWTPNITLEQTLSDILADWRTR